MRAVAEREVLGGFAPADVEPVGVGEHLGIAVGGADGDEHVGVGGQLDAARTTGRVVRRRQWITEES